MNKQNKQSRKILKLLQKLNLTTTNSKKELKISIDSKTNNQMLES